MPLALVTLAESLTYGRAAFIDGLHAAGYQVVRKIQHPTPDDVIVIWNRYAQHNIDATRFERVGAKVLVAENGYMGKEWIGKKWFALARNHHNGAGTWFHGGPDRWASWGFELAPWREGGTEVLILPQRGFGEPGVAMPKSWQYHAQNVLRAVPNRVRPHPGPGDAGVMRASLAADLQNAYAAATWASGAGIQALAMGVPVFADYPKWIGASCCTPLNDWLSKGPLASTTLRLQMFERLAWAMWTLEEVSAGEPFKYLL